jgi:hypothetical protein
MQHRLGRNGLCRAALVSTDVPGENEHNRLIS